MGALRAVGGVPRERSEQSGIVKWAQAGSLGRRALLGSSEKGGGFGESEVAVFFFFFFF